MGLGRRSSRRGRGGEWGGAELPRGPGSPRRLPVFPFQGGGRRLATHRRRRWATANRSGGAGEGRLSQVAPRRRRELGGGAWLHLSLTLAQWALLFLFGPKLLVYKFRDEFQTKRQIMTSSELIPFPCTVRPKTPPGPREQPTRDAERHGVLPLLRQASYALPAHAERTAGRLSTTPINFHAKQPSMAVCHGITRRRHGEMPK